MTATANIPHFPEAHPNQGAIPALATTERMGRIVAVTGGHAVVLLDSHEGVFANSL